MSASPDPLEADVPAWFPPHVASALPDFALAAFCVTAWIAPGRLAAGSVRWVLLAMLLEFIVMHSAAFMGLQLYAPGSRARRALNVVGLGMFYSMFAAGFSLGFHTWWPLVSFWLLTLNRLTGVFFRQAPGGEEQAFLQSGWAASAVSYLFGVMLTLVLPVPRLGLTSAVVSALALPGHGIWISQPWRVVAFGALYYAAMGAFELNGFRALRAGLPGRPAS